MFIIAPLTIALFTERQHKKVDKSVKLSASVSAGKAPASAYDLKAALEEIRSQPLPSTVEEREKYFLEQLAVGEALIARGISLFHLYSLGYLVFMIYS